MIAMQRVARSGSLFTCLTLCQQQCHASVVLLARVAMTERECVSTIRSTCGFWKGYAKYGHKA